MANARVLAPGFTNSPLSALNVAIAQVHATLALVRATNKQTAAMVDYETWRRRVLAAEDRATVATRLVGTQLQELEELRASAGQSS